jgi:hypothetical protein
MAVQGCWRYVTCWGVFAIVPIVIGGRRRYEVRFDDGALGVYPTPEQALTREPRAGTIPSFPICCRTSRQAALMRSLPSGTRGDQVALFDQGTVRTRRQPSRLVEAPQLLL